MGSATDLDAPENEVRCALVTDIVSLNAQVRLCQ
jgi:hypothetical protein